MGEVKELVWCNLEQAIIRSRQLGWRGDNFVRVLGKLMGECGVDEGKNVVVCVDDGVDSMGRRGRSRGRPSH